MAGCVSPADPSTASAPSSTSSATSDAAPIALATLAERNRLPPKFLEQIMSTLKHGGIVRTTLGAHGGYAMAMDPADGHRSAG